MTNGNTLALVVRASDVLVIAGLVNLNGRDLEVSVPEIVVDEDAGIRAFAPLESHPSKGTPGPVGTACGAGGVGSQGVSGVPGRDAGHISIHVETLSGDGRLLVDSSGEDGGQGGDGGDGGAGGEGSPGDHSGPLGGPFSFWIRPGSPAGPGGGAAREGTEVRAVLVDRLEYAPRWWD